MAITQRTKVTVKRGLKPQSQQTVYTHLAVQIDPMSGMLQFGQFSNLDTTFKCYVLRGKPQLYSQDVLIDEVNLDAAGQPFQYKIVSTPETFADTHVEMIISISGNK